jgi:hypothetical protein
MGNDKYFLDPYKCLVPQYILYCKYSIKHHPRVDRLRSIPSTMVHCTWYIVLRVESKKGSLKEKKTSISLQYSVVTGSALELSVCTNTQKQTTRSLNKTIEKLFKNICICKLEVYSEIIPESSPLWTMCYQVQYYTKQYTPCFSSRPAYCYFSRVGVVVLVVVVVEVVEVLLPGSSS